MRIVNIMISNNFGGIEQVSLDYCECLVNRGHQVLAISRTDSISSTLLRQIQSQSSNLTTVEVAAKGGLPALGSIIKIFATCQRFNPDIIIAHNYLHLSIWATRWFAPIVSLSHLAKSKHIHKLEAFIVFTEALYKKYEPLMRNGSKLYQLPNMIRGPFYRPEAKLKDTLVFGALGRLAEGKGFEVLIDGCHVLKQKGLNFKCIIGGAGSMQSQLENQIQSLGLSDCVVLVGFIKDKKAFFEHLDVCVSASLSETFGLTLLEAMKFGKALIATNVGFVKDCFVDQENAIIVPSDDAIALAEGMEALITNPDICNTIAENNHQLLNEAYSMEVVGARLEAILEAIVQGQK